MAAAFQKSWAKQALLQQHHLFQIYLTTVISFRFHYYQANEILPQKLNLDESDSDSSSSDSSSGSSSSGSSSSGSDSEDEKEEGKEVASNDRPKIPIGENN